MGGCKFDCMNLQALGTCWGHSAATEMMMLPGRPTTTNTRSMTVMEGPAPKLLFLPYIAGVTERNERVCRPLGIRVICGDKGRMRETLVKVKYPVENAIMCTSVKQKGL